MPKTKLIKSNAKNVRTFAKFMIAFAMISLTVSGCATVTSSGDGPLFCEAYVEVNPFQCETDGGQLNIDLNNGVWVEKCL